MVQRIANELMAREYRFIEAYVLEPRTIGNGAASARAAGYAPKHAARIAYKVLRRPLVQKEIAKLRRLRELVGAMDSLGMLRLPPDLRPVGDRTAHAGRADPLRRAEAPPAP